ncbi:MAG: hypothetical protein ACI4SK_00170 [Christensenellales bacterium]
MKKGLTIILSLTLLACIALFACACEKNAATLEAPANVAIGEDGLITWDAVANATGYVVYVDDAAYPTTSNSYQVTDLTKSFNFYVKATAGEIESAPSEVKTYTASITPVPPKGNVSVGIKGSSEIKSGKTAAFTASVTGSDDKEVSWSISEGGEFATVNSDGVVTAKEVSGDKIITLQARSKADATAVAKKAIVIVAKPVLTQEMLDVFDDVVKMSFEGYMSIELYSKGLTNKLEKTFVSVIKTAMDSDGHWYAEYEDANTGVNQGIYYANHGGIACETGLGLTNEAKYYPLTDDDGNDLTWEKSGLYNSLGELTVADFEFNEETWRYEYRYKNTEYVKKVIASANPYDFETETFGLLIDDGEVMGICAKSKPDNKLLEGYVAYEDLFVAVNYKSTVTVPTIPVYEFDPEMHTLLKTALENMHALNSYTLEYNEASYYLITSTQQNVGYVETVTANDCYFVPFDVKVDSHNNKAAVKRPEDAYGYHKISDSLYNSFYRAGDKYVASRAFDKDFNNAKPSFAFAPEIFRNMVVNDDTGETVYFVESIMCNVATTFYYGVGNDINLYGIYATSAINDYYPYVTVKEVDGKPYITEAGFYFYLGPVFGFATFTYRDFDTAEIADVLPEGKTEVSFETRNTPVSWDDKNLTVIVSKDSSSTEDDEELPARAYISEFLGAEKREITSIDISADGKITWAENGAAFYLASVEEQVSETATKTYFQIVEEGFFDAGVASESLVSVKVYAYSEDRSDMMPFFGAPLGDTFGFALTGMKLRSGANIMKPIIQFYYDVPLDIDYSIDSSLKAVGDYLISLGFVKNRAGEYVKDGVIVLPKDESLDFIIYVWYDPTV